MVSDAQLSPVDLAAWVSRGDEQHRGFREAVHIVISAISDSAPLRTQMIMKGGLLMAIRYDSTRFTRDVDFSTREKYASGSEQALLAELDQQLERFNDAFGYDTLCRRQRAKLNPPRSDATFPTLTIGIGYAARSNARQLQRLLQLHPLPTAGISMMRLQHEALTRAAWLLYAATDEQIDRLVAPLDAAAEKAASKLPMAKTMLDEIVDKAPHGAVEMLTHFKDVNAPALHSFVHGGIHAIQRGLTGYSVEMLANVMRSSNGLYTMAGMLLAILSGDEALAKRMSKIQPRFADCLPPLIAPAAKPEPRCAVPINQPPGSISWHSLLCGADTDSSPQFLCTHTCTRPRPRTRKPSIHAASRPISLSRCKTLNSFSGGPRRSSKCRQSVVI